jgi:hypothetical protein
MGNGLKFSSGMLNSPSICQFNNFWEGDLSSKEKIKTADNSRFKKCGIFRLESISSHPTFV